MLYPGLEEYAVTELVTTMLRWSSAVFTLCGSANAPTASDASLHTQLRRIAEAVYKLARVTREDILSTTFDVLIVDSGAPFEPGHMLNKMEHDMEEHVSQIADVGLGLNPSANRSGILVGADGDLNGSANGNGAQDSGRVLCTTELGLRCVTRRDLKSTSGFPEAGAEADLFESRLLLQPKVLLDSAMDVIERG